jgi:hypothetical protein
VIKLRVLNKAGKCMICEKLASTDDVIAFYEAFQEDVLFEGWANSGEVTELAIRCGRDPVLLCSRECSEVFERRLSALLLQPNLADVISGTWNVTVG